MGRKATKDSVRSLSFRFNVKHSKMLDELCVTTGMSKTLLLEEMTEILYTIYGKKVVCIETHTEVSKNIMRVTRKLKYTGTL